MIYVVYYPDSSTHLAIGTTGLGKDKNIYISFFPGNERSIAGFRLHNLDHDRFSNKNQQAQRAATIVILPSEESCGYGLSEQAIYDWWHQFNAKKESFGWLTNNCSSIVYRALCEAHHHSTTLKSNLLEYKQWFCTPSSVLAYASELNELMLSEHTMQDNLFLKFAEIKQICELGQGMHAVGQIASLYLRIKQLCTAKMSSLLLKPFCESVTAILTEYDNAGSTPNDLDIDKSYNQLNLLVSSALNDDGKTRLNELITTKLLAPLATYIESFTPANLQNIKLINIALDQAASLLDESKNPKRKYVQKGDTMPPEFRNITFGSTF